jgi:hypothetical protein
MGAKQRRGGQLSGGVALELGRYCNLARQRF